MDSGPPSPGDQTCNRPICIQAAGLGKGAQSPCCPSLSRPVVRMWPHGLPGSRAVSVQAPTIPLVTQRWPLAVLVGTVRTPIDVHGVPGASGSECARKPPSAMRARAEPRSDRLTCDMAVTICVCAQSTVGNLAVRSCRYRRRVQGGPPAGAFPFAQTPPRPEATAPISRLLFLSRTRSAGDPGSGPASPHVMATAITEKDTEVPRGTQQARAEARLSWLC